MIDFFSLSLIFFAGHSANLLPASPEHRAIAYLAREVPRWPREHQCFSCHNNAEGARALLMARRRELKVPDEALATTQRWLLRPQDWEQKRGKYNEIDRTLTFIHFGNALSEAIKTGVLKDEATLRQAARTVASTQDQAGFWQVDEGGAIGSPVTLGSILATHLACRVLRHADAKGHAKALARASAWLREQKVQNVFEAGSMLLALAGENDERAMEQKRLCGELIRKGQGKDGGWGPYVTSPAEPFDTAVVLIAFSQQPKNPADEERIRRGRAYLIATQLADGDWPATTRPAGGESYAQHLSTSAWATQALLETMPRAEKSP